MTLRERLRGLGVHPFLIALGLAAVAMLFFALPQGGAQDPPFDDLYLCSADGHTGGIPVGREGTVDAISTDRQTVQAVSGTQTGTLWGMYLSASNVAVEDVVNEPLDCTLKLRFLVDGRPATGFYRCDGLLQDRPNTYAVRIWLNKTRPLPDAGKCESGNPDGGDSGHGVENAIPLMTGGAAPSPQPVQPQPQPEPEQEPEPEAEDQIDDEDDSEDQDTPNEDDDESQDEASPADDDEHPQSDPETTDERDNEQVDGSADESDTEESAVTTPSHRNRKEIRAMPRQTARTAKTARMRATPVTPT